MRPALAIATVSIATAAAFAAPPKKPPPTVDEVLKAVYAATSQPTLPAGDLLGISKAAVQDLRRARKLDQERADLVKQSILKLNDYTKARFDRVDLTKRFPTIVRQWDDRVKTAEASLAEAKSTLRATYSYPPSGDSRHYLMLERRVKKAADDLEKTRRSRDREVSGIELRIKRLPAEIDKLRMEATKLLEPHLAQYGKVSLPGSDEAWKLDVSVDALEDEQRDAPDSRRFPR